METDNSARSEKLSADFGCCITGFTDIHTDIFSETNRGTSKYFTTAKS